MREIAVRSHQDIGGGLPRQAAPLDLREYSPSVQSVIDSVKRAGNVRKQGAIEELLQVGEFTAALAIASRIQNPSIRVKSYFEIGQVQESEGGDPTAAFNCVLSDIRESQRSPSGGSEKDVLEDSDIIVQEIVFIYSVREEFGKALEAAILIEEDLAREDSVTEIVSSILDLEEPPNDLAPSVEDEESINSAKGTLFTRVIDVLYYLGEIEKIEEFIAAQPTRMRDNLQRHFNDLIAAQQP